MNSNINNIPWQTFQCMIDVAYGQPVLVHGPAVVFTADAETFITPLVVLQPTNAVQNRDFLFGQPHFPPQAMH